MPYCKSIDTCPFFNNRMNTTPHLAKLYKTSFCKGDHTKCARFIVADALGKNKVPDDLYPNQTVRAKKIIQSQ